MRRFLIFGLLGPVLGFIVVRYGFLASTAHLDPRELVLLPVAFFLGLLPALAAAWIDKLLSDRGVRLRPLWMAAIGFAVSFLPILAALIYLGSTDPLILLWGFIGAVPAFICSLLCGPSRVVARD